MSQSAASTLPESNAAPASTALATTRPLATCGTATVSLRTSHRSGPGSGPTTPRRRLLPRWPLHQVDAQSVRQGVSRNGARGAQAGANQQPDLLVRIG